MHRLLPVGWLLLATAAPGFCQKTPKAPKTPPSPTPPARVAARPGATARAPGNNPNGKGAAPRLRNPLNPAQRFLNMTPEEQERVLEKATPQQRERLNQALENWKRLPQAQRDFAYRQYQSLAALPPAQQVLVSHQIAAFNQLPEDRIGPVRQELLQLLRMPAEERPSRFAAPDFASRYSPGEQQILKGLSTNLPPDYPLARR
jgi:hypothetical protein